MDPQSLSATFAGISALAAIITSAIAAFSLIGSRRDSHDRTRPVITATLRKGPSMSHGVTYLVIENAGQSVARDVEIDFDPPLPEYETTSDGQPGIVAPILRKRYANPIPILAPGHRLKNIYSYIGVGHDGNVEKVPDQFTVHAKYTDDRNRKYNDSFPLDREVLGLETQSSPGGSNEPTKRQNKAIEAIAWELWD
ncbi:hypothetical protein ACFQZ2_08485 [Streptomonospora algeriensis]|uniref:Uncharacterized protein n=1 Tax=Streptomonospora algeriensis TaxID=995084 RepID=A0ABW3BFC1_9ACTN